MSRKLAATQELARKDTEIDIERKERTKREGQAEGVANAMQPMGVPLTGTLDAASGAPVRATPR